MDRKLIFVLIAALVVVIVAAAFLINIKKDNTAARGVSDTRLSAGNAIAQARELEDRGELQEAKQVYQRLINERPGSEKVLEWQKKAEELAVNLLFSTTVTPKSVLYTIRPGDTLISIQANHLFTSILIFLNGDDPR